MGSFELTWRGQKIKAEAELIDGVWWIQADGEILRHDTRGVRRSRKSGGSAGSGSLLAPMPGKITRIFQSIGQTVQKGDSILVMEAMKMEYTLKAEVSGILSNLQCAVGDQVSMGALLALIEPLQEKK